MSRQASEFQEKSMSLIYRGKEIFKEPLKNSNIEELKRRSGPNWAGSKIILSVIAHFLRPIPEKGRKIPVMLPAAFVRLSPGGRGLRRQT